MIINKQSRKGEMGNVLFLILIAVALFAALSYAVTQSTRSGGGSTEREKAILSGASMTQYPTALRTSIIRMVLGGVDVSSIKFNAPSSVYFKAGGTDITELVFHPNGGGAVYQQAPADLMTGNNQGTWHYNANFDVPDVGTSGDSGNDVIAFLPNVTQRICQQINDEFAISTTGCTMTNGGVPDLDGTLTEANIDLNLDDLNAFPTGDQEDMQGAGGTCVAFSGQPSGCFYDTANTRYVFYSVLLER